MECVERGEYGVVGGLGEEEEGWEHGVTWGGGRNRRICRLW